MSMEEVKQKKNRGSGEREKDVKKPKRARKDNTRTVTCGGFLMDERFSGMIEFLNFYSLIAFQNSKADLYNRTGIQSDIPEPGLERTIRGNVPLSDLVHCEDRNECYAIKKVACVIPNLT